MTKIISEVNLVNIARDKYLRDLINRMNNGMIKVVTGIRRSGKSYLLFKLFYEYLLSQGVLESHIIKIELDQRKIGYTGIRMSFLIISKLLLRTINNTIFF